MDQTAEYKLEKRAVNSKALFAKIHEFVDEGIITGQVIWSNDVHRTSFIEILDELLTDVGDDGLIDQWNIICDLRNNTIADMDQGIYVLEVTYRQKNCLNTTRLIYTIKDLLISSIKHLVDFQI